MPGRLKLLTITEKASAPNPLGPVHPGEILREEFLAPLELSAYALAAACHIPRTRIERLVREETPVTPDTALRLARYFGTSAEFWLGIQARFDLEVARRELEAEIAAIEPRRNE
ncbi:MAG: HigA family addiction module antidote protein [Rhodomicrobium sp.]|nr:HigA family addiction module antidote protein [Rhodomicrobium sp.]